jgi:hypothetical protein
VKRFIIAVALLISLPCFAQSDVTLFYKCNGKFLQPLPKGNPSGCQLVAWPDSDWSLYGIGENALNFVNKGSVRPQGKYRKVWLLSVFPKEESVNNVRFLSEKALVYFDCVAGSVGIKQILYYSDELGQTPIDGGSINIGESDVDFSDSAPNSAGDQLLKIVCGKLPR